MADRGFNMEIDVHDEEALRLLREHPARWWLRGLDGVWLDQDGDGVIRLATLWGVVIAESTTVVGVFDAALRRFEEVPGLRSQLIRSRWARGPGVLQATLVVPGNGGLRIEN